MTIFDRIKYPISDKPTFQELDALPDEIYNKWKESAKVDWSRETTAFMLDNVFNLVGVPLRKRHDIQKNLIKLLRQIILNHDNI